MAVSAIRLLAEKFGEEKLVIAVLSAVAPLARMQFPAAKVLAMPLLSKRRVLNLFAANALRAFPAWLTILREKFSVAVSFRHHRNYLQSFLLFTSGAGELFLTDNMLSHDKKNTRDRVESFLSFLKKNDFVAYPETAILPLDLEANRRVVSSVLGREVLVEEILPKIETRAGKRDGSILFSPLSSTPIKDYPLGSWMRVFGALPEGWKSRPIWLVGSPAQREELGRYLAGLREKGFRESAILETADVAELAGAIAGASLTLTVDTASAHIACACGNAAVILFSGLHRGVYGPWTKNERQVWIEAAEEKPGEGARKKSHWHKAISPDFVASEILRVAGGEGELAARAGIEPAHQP